VTGRVNTGSVIEPEPVSPVKTSSKPTERPRRDLVAIYTAEIGVTESGGNNRGPRVEEYLAATGLPGGNPWCAAFVRWSFDQAGLKTDITAWSPTAYDRKKVVWKNGWKDEFRQGQVFTIYYSRLGRIGHTGFADRMVNENLVETVEGNTNDGGSREGDGVYRKKRSLNSLFAICEFR
jgi:hypothetical protein